MFLIYILPTIKDGLVYFASLTVTQIHQIQEKNASMRSHGTKTKTILQDHGFLMIAVASITKWKLRLELNHKTFTLG